MNKIDPSSHIKSHVVRRKCTRFCSAVSIMFLLLLLGCLYTKRSASINVILFCCYVLLLHQHVCCQLQLTQIFCFTLVGRFSTVARNFRPYKMKILLIINFYIFMNSKFPNIYKIMTIVKSNRKYLFSFKSYI